MKNSLILSFFVLLFSGCSKDDQAPFDELDGCGLPTNVGFIEKYPVTTYLTFNPNNPDEFAFLKDDFISICCQQELVIYNMATKASRTIYEGSIGSFEWSKQGKIIWQDSNTRFLFSMNETGDSIFQLPLDTSATPGIIPDSLPSERQPSIYTLSPDGKRIFYDYYDSGGTGGRQIAIADLQGRRLKQQLSSSFYYLTRWLEDETLSTLAYYDNYVRFEFYDLNHLFSEQNKLFTTSVIFSNIGSVLYMDWVDDRTLVFSTEKGIYTANLPSSLSGVATTNQIMEAKCFAEGYMRFAVDRQRQKLLVQRFIPEKTDNNPGTKTSEYLLMNLDGSEKTIIEIPGL